MGRKNGKRMGRLIKLYPIITYSLDYYDDVISNKITNVEDYWFVWDNDYEPIRVIYRKKIINKTLHRMHWIHRIVEDPFLTEENKIEVFFLPDWHTPLIRKSKTDLGFYIAISVTPTPNRIDNYDVNIDKEIPEYYITAGDKGEHPPLVSYDGWPSLEDDAEHQDIRYLISNIISSTISWIKKRLGIESK